MSRVNHLKKISRKNLTSDTAAAALGYASSVGLEEELKTGVTQQRKVF
jgi:hypothetical protein